MKASHSRMPAALAAIFFALSLPGTALGANVTARYVPGMDCSLASAAWAAAPDVETALTQAYESYEAPYDIYLPPNPEGPTLPDRPLLVNAMHDGATLCMRFRWADATEDLKTDEIPIFADAFAIEFPFFGEDVWGNEGLGAEIPHAEPATHPLDVFLGRCPESYHMGAYDPTPYSTQPCGVWIAFWRANYHPEDNPVQNLTGVGMGTIQRIGPIVTTPEAAWDGTGWTLVLKRPLAGETNVVELRPGHHYPIAYAQWDGSLEERSGRKFATDDWGDNLVIEP